MANDDAWMLNARCRQIPNPDSIFFPPSHKGVKTDTRPAKQVCSQCPVRKSCLVYAVVHRENSGVWGGYSPAERKAIPRDTKRKWRAIWYRLYPMTKVVGGRR